MKDNNIKTGSWRAWVLAARPKTLAGAAVPVMIGLSLALKRFCQTGTNTLESIHSWPDVIVISLLCVLFAFIMQIDANFINDYFDFMKGNDDETRLGPKRACAMGWIHSTQMRRAIIITTAFACLIGLPLLFYGGTMMILVGILCVIFCFLYTTHLSYLGMGDLLVLVFFGIIPVCVPYYIIIKSLTWGVFIASIACGLVIDTLLMINNYRDLENDARVGKRTLAVRLGKEMSKHSYLGLGLIASLMGIIYIFMGYIWAFLLPFVYVFLHVMTYRQMVQIDHGSELNIILGKTARNMFLYGLLVCIGIWLGE